MNRKKRPVVAFFNGNIHDPHSMTLIRLFYDGFAEDDIDFHYYMGTDLHGFLWNNLLTNLHAENHYYSLFSYVAYDKPDVIIVTMGGLTNSSQAFRVEEFLSHFPKVPVIMLENDTKSPGVTHVLIDNYAGMYAATEHLITVHGVKKIAHLAGPQNNEEAVRRKNAFRDAMEAHGLSAGLIAYGDFTRDVRAQVDELLDQNPEAIASANDMMAETIYRVADERGLTIGKDLLVTGFDDMASSSYTDPPLSTVRQDYSRIVDSAIRQVRRILSGEEVKDVLIPAEYICRNSCGCTRSACPVPSNEETGQKLLKNEARIRNMIIQTLENTVILRNMLNQELNQERLFCNLGDTFCRLGVKRSFLLIYEKPLVRHGRKVVDAPEVIRMVLAQEGDQVEYHSLENAPRIHRGELRDWVQTEERTRFTDFVLFYQDLEYGVLIVDIPPEEVIYFYSLSIEIGSGFHYLELLMEREAVQQALEEKNQILEYSAHHDILTGLYNRAGLMNRILKYVRSYPPGSRFLLVMADLDHLKQINDNFGHNEGDAAICKVSEILQQIFSSGSPLGRNGGDEFLIVTHLEQTEEEWEQYCEKQKAMVSQKVKTICDLENNKEDSRYYIGVSVGCASFRQQDLGRILEVIQEADCALYEEKKHRRASILKESS